MITRIFTLEDQEVFAKLSGDYNQVHVDRVAARRFLFGGLVVHGIHALLWALDKWLEGPEKPRELVSLKVSFRKPLHVGEDIQYRMVLDENNYVELELCRGALIYASIGAEYRIQEVNNRGDVNFHLPPAQACNILSSDEIAHVSGALGLCIEKNTALALFPHVVAKLPLMQTAEILTTSRLVGMECPGFHSIFFGLDVGFNSTRPLAKTLTYKVASYDNSYSLLVMDVEGASMRGAVLAFLRPPPTQQTSYAELLKLVPADEFKDQQALIIGGSRGLGEVTAKLLAAGGANVVLTYYSGKEDAIRVVDEIVSNGGRASLMFFNILSLTESQGDGVAKRPFTHMYYFATPHIATNRGPFSARIFKEFCDYYVSGFSESVEWLLKHETGLKKVFYASTVYVEQPPLSLVEYVMAKAAGEHLCSLLEKRHTDLGIYVSRLPPMATDQTASIFTDERAAPATIMLPQLVTFKKDAPSGVV